MFDAALMSTVLYGCESWFQGDLRPVERLYNWGIKQLLGVRMTTCTDLCYVELGYPPLKYLVKAKQRKFFSKLWNERRGMDDDPWVHATKITLATNTPTARCIKGLIEERCDDVQFGLEHIKQVISTSSSSRRVTYMTLNPNLSIHPVYKERGGVNEVHRAAFSRLRVIGHNLAIETGRWNRRGRGRLEVAERLCQCGDVQTEMHVIESCPLTQTVRDQFGFTTWAQLIDDQSQFAITDITYKILDILK